MQHIVFVMLKSSYIIPILPPKVDLETKAILKALNKAHRPLAELKGRASAIPNQGILINTLALQEAKASSEIENIVTTQDELFREGFLPGDQTTPNAKEVALYRDALTLGFEDLRSNNGILRNGALIDMFRLLKNRDDGFRVLPGTALLNDKTDEIVYVPPQNATNIANHMTQLEAFINDGSLSSLDPLVKMAIIHHQFESIHPFPDGNGRIGRILNVLYLTQTGLLEIPILYLSRHITQTKNKYYHLLQDVRDSLGAAQAWEAWVLYMLEAVADTAQMTLNLIEGLRTLMAEYKQRMRTELPKLYSQDLLNNLFRHPYTRIDYVMKDLSVGRQAAARYLDKLANAGFVEKHQSGRNNYYINSPLLDLFFDISGGK